MNRTKVLYRGKEMRHFRAIRIAAMEPLINRANTKRMTIPEAADWIGISQSTLRSFVRILKIKWRTRRDRTVYRHCRIGWESTIIAGLREGKTLEKIGKQLGVGHWMVSRYVKQNGLWAVALDQEPK